MQAVLGSWKEIANYLGKGVRTVQRWERYSGLPIHRPSGTSKGVVIAFPDELDKWARRQDPEGNEESRSLAKRNAELSAELAHQTRQLHSRTSELLRRTVSFKEMALKRQTEMDGENDGSSAPKAH